jgi:hypothetical protein
MVSGFGVQGLPLSSEYGTYKTVKARFWTWLSVQSPQILSNNEYRGENEDEGEPTYHILPYI